MINNFQASSFAVYAYRYIVYAASLALWHGAEELGTDRRTGRQGRGAQPAGVEGEEGGAVSLLTSRMRGWGWLLLLLHTGGPGQPDAHHPGGPVTATGRVTLMCDHPTPPHPALHCPIPYPTLPYPTLPYPTLPYPTLPYPTLPYPALPCPALLCPALPCPALPCPVLPCPALPCPALLACPALPCPALPCSALPCPALPCPALPCMCFQGMYYSVD